MTPNKVRDAPVVTPDETGWRVGGERHWLWVFATPDTTVYAICPGRGFDDALTVLECRLQRRAHPRRVGALSVLRRGAAPDVSGAPAPALQAPSRRPSRQHLGLLSSKRCCRPGSPCATVATTGQLTDHGLASVRGRLLARLGRLIDEPPPLAAAERFAAHLHTEFAAVFTFLWDPSVDATNWRAEQAIRPAVVTRKVCGGNRTRHGADTQQVLASVVRTAHQRDLNLAPLIATMLRATNAIVPDGLQRPPPPLMS